MATSPILITPRLRLEPFGECHLSERYIGWLNDPALTRYSEQRHTRHSLESCRAYWQAFAGTPHYFWAALAGDLGHIGNLNAYVDLRHGVADVGILIGESAAQGQGYATEAWLAACDFLLRERGLRKVTAGTIAPNRPMLRLMERAGMAPDGRRVAHYLWEGEAVDMIHAALFREAWLERFPRGPFEK